jgi:two-component system phosphate regulon response regulator PhoB
MQQERVLVVDDEEDILELVRYNLDKEGYRVTTVSSGEEGLRAARSDLPDLVILDLMLPGVDGLEVCKSLKADRITQAIKIIMLSARGEEADIVAGLELGADDYITKPFSPRILSARIKATLRRNSAIEPDQNAVLNIGSLLIDPVRHETRIRKDLLELTATEFKLLHFLARQRGRVFTRHQIVDGVHGDDYPVTDRSVDVQVVGLRKKLGNYGKLIETVRGIGYRFKSDEANSSLL